MSVQRGKLERIPVVHHCHGLIFYASASASSPAKIAPTAPAFVRMLPFDPVEPEEPDADVVDEGAEPRPIELELEPKPDPVAVGATEETLIDEMGSPEVAHAFVYWSIMLCSCVCKELA